MMIVGLAKLKTMAFHNRNDIVAITLFNGLGDYVIARPVLEECARTSRKTILFCDNDLCFDIFEGMNIDIIMCPDNEVVRGTSPNYWYSLNAYSPIPKEEVFLRYWENIGVRGFQDVISLPGFNDLTPMVNQYRKVIGLSENQKFSQSHIPIAKKDVVRVLEKTRLSGIGNSFLTIHNESLDEKQWDAVNLECFCCEVTKRGGNILLFSEEAVTHIALNKSTKYLDLSFKEKIALLYLSDVFVGIDSVFMHIADSFRKLGVVLFGPTNPKVWGPTGETLTILQGDGGSVMSIDYQDVLDCILSQYWNEK